MLIFRYLAKEVFVTLITLTTILLFIFMSNQFVRYLNRAATGQIPGMIIMKLMMLELPNLIGLLLPLGFYVALLLSYGRLYADNEMTVLKACGYGTPQLVKHSLLLAFFVTILVIILMVWVSPLIAMERAKLMKTTGIQTLIKTIIPGRFRALPGGKEVFYVESMSTDHTKASHIFLARYVPKNNLSEWDIVLAKKAYAETEPNTFEDYIVLEDGRGYKGIVGQANYEISEFKQYKTRLPHPSIALNSDLRSAKTQQLLPLLNVDRKKAAELQWRLSVPLMVIMLTVVAIPLSRVNPRGGKFAKLLPAILVYIIYANFIFVSRDWIIAGKIPIWLGIWWLHLAILGVGLALLGYNRWKLA